MPIYKYSRHEVQERRAVRLHRRMRLAALVLSSLLVLGTLALVFGHRLAGRVAGSPTQPAEATPQAASSLGVHAP